MVKYKVLLVSSTTGDSDNWAIRCRDRLYNTREEAEAAIAADPYAKPDDYGNTCELEIVEIEIDMDDEDDDVV